MDSIVLTKTLFIIGNTASFLYFFYIGLRAFSGVMYLFSCRWFFSLNLVFLFQGLITALFNEFGDHAYDYRFYLVNYLGVLLSFIFVAFLWLKPKSYVGFNVKDSLLREGVVSVLKEMNIIFEETIGSFKLPSVTNELRINVQSWLGRAKVRLKNNDIKLLDDLAQRLNVYFQNNTLSGNRTVCIIYLFLALLMAANSTYTFLHVPFIPNHGRGAVVLHGVRYEGQFKNHILQGHAFITYPNGSKYDGNVKNWEPEGQGVLAYKSGQTYTGGFKDNNFDGNGRMTFTNGSWYEGEFKDGFYNGQGTFVNFNGNTYKGGFKNNDFEGHGTILLGNGDKYEGDVKNWLGEGKGTYFSAQGSTYEGNFKAGVLQDEGIIHYANGNKYQGQILNWMAEGKGVLIYSNGTKYEGNFKMDMPDYSSAAGLENGQLPNVINDINLESNNEDIPVNPVMNFNGMGGEQILNLRKININQAQSLMPANYEPSDKIFAQIQNDKAWWGLLGVSYYGPGKNSILGNSKESRFILNPYLLLGMDETGAHPVAVGSALPPEEIYPKAVRLAWDKGGKWAHVVYNVSDYYRTAMKYNFAEGKNFFISDYNARDFGFNYLTIDSKHSINISAATDQVLPIIQYIHVGGSCGYPGGCNNSSPWQEALKIQWVELPARLYLKLWRSTVSDPSQKSDMDYIIDLK